MLENQNWIEFAIGPTKIRSMVLVICKINTPKIALWAQWNYTVVSLFCVQQFVATVQIRLWLDIMIYVYFAAWPVVAQLNFMATHRKLCLMLVLLTENFQRQRDRFDGIALWKLFGHFCVVTQLASYFHSCTVYCSTIKLLLY